MTRSWESVESRSLLSSADEAMVGRVRGAAAELDRLLRLLPPTITLMRDHMAGQPRAASVGGGGQRLAWCWVHEQTVKDCEVDGWLCSGEILSGPGDPAGEAAAQVATVGDRAVRHHREVAGRLELLVRVVREVSAVMAGYPCSPLEDDEEDPSPGEDLCRSCWKDDRYAQFIELQANGTPYYRGLCRWCGQKRKLIGGDRLPDGDPTGDPPTWMVKMFHSGQRVNSGHIAKAEQALANRVASSQAKKGKGKKRKS